MKITLIVLAFLMTAIAGCQSVPKERKNNCACNWETMEGYKEGAAA
jgi:hypothetical protein